jgi:hypothetical protein
MITLSDSERRYNLEHLQVDSLWAFHKSVFFDVLAPAELKSLLAYYPQGDDIENVFEYRKDLLLADPTIGAAGREALYKVLRSIDAEIEDLYRVK